MSAGQDDLLRKIERLESDLLIARTEATNRENRLYEQLRDLLDQLDIKAAAWSGGEKAMRERAEKASPLTAATWKATAGTLASCRESIQELVKEHEVRGERL